MADTQALVETGGKFLYPNYRQPPLVMARGQGCELFDTDGKRYLDLYAGIAVSTLGHNHPALVGAISEQAAKVLHLSNYYYNEPNVRLAERLCKHTGLARAFFCNSGTEAIEALLKLARRHFFSRGKEEKVRVVAFEQSFHGRTLGALSMTGQPGYREGFGPLSPATHVPYGDLSAVEAALGPDAAAILVEAVQGEGGVRPAPEGFLQGLRELADKHDVLLLADEVQTGIGRTGSFLGFQHFGVKPDAIALAKGLAGGVPIGSMLCQDFLAGALPPGSHGSTFGGSPLAAAAANAVLDVMEQDDLMGAVRETGAWLSKQLTQIANKHTLVEEARGIGLMQALLLREGADARGIVAKLRDDKGVLVTVAGGRALRFTPPLTITREQLAEGLEAVDAIVGEHAEAS